LDLSSVPTSGELRDDFLLFSESNGRLLVEVPEGHCATFEVLMEDTIFAKVGVVRAEKALTIRRAREVLMDLPLGELMAAWKTPLEAAR
ncbi:MAG: phosphoribosylformylglycinamidine synthase subunit PurL, partial [Candidatus Bathyarchaeota archaeon]|nr:phosphoribosylformylglycinamidine synthase subunit PurL [Candidatus Bathyarchaeota archaeon]